MNIIPPSMGTQVFAIGGMLTHSDSLTAQKAQVL
jgi:hypothetical protein